MSEKDAKTNLEELIESIRKNPIKKYDRLDFLYVRISVLLDYVMVIKDNASQLKEPANIAIIKAGLHPAQQLIEYVVQEISSFYTLAYKYSQISEIPFPKFPDYWKTLKDFRNKIPGHLDDRGELKTGEDWLEIYKGISKIGVVKIISDFLIFYNEYVKLESKLEGNKVVLRRKG